MKSRQGPNEEPTGPTEYQSLDQQLIWMNKVPFMLDNRSYNGELGKLYNQALVT